MSNYIDMADQIIHDHGAPCGNIRLGIRSTLSWLDSHPDQVPGRTITDSELETITHDLATYGGPVLGTRIRVHLAHIGVTVIPDPKPTNAEKLAKMVRRACDNLTPIQRDEITRYFDEAGVKAPEADDD